MNRIKSSLTSLKSWPISSSPTIVVEPDLELGNTHVPKPEPQSSTESDQEPVVADAPRIQPKIEDYPPGYPQYSALISSHDLLFSFRSYRRLRARLLLKKQDELSLLEEQLDAIDDKEERPFRLGSSRSDDNVTRSKVLAQIQSKLAEYDTLMDQCRQVMNYNRASPQMVQSLHNWLEGSGGIIDEEMEYLKKDKDLITPAPTSDPAMLRLEEWVEQALARYYKGFRERPGFETSSNPDVYIYSGTLIKTLATVLMLVLIILLLLLPIVICMVVENMSARISIIIVATACFLAVLARLTKSRMIELILAGATFATVLNVFVSNS